MSNKYKILIIAVLLNAYVFGFAPDALSITPSPELISPDNYSTASGTTVTFRWHKVEGATNYYFYLTSIYGEVIHRGWIGDYGGVYVNFMRDNGEQYWWAVVALLDVGNTRVKFSPVILQGQELSAAMDKLAEASKKFNAAFVKGSGGVWNSIESLSSGRVSKK